MLLAVAAVSRDALSSAVLNLVWIVFGGESLVAALRRQPARDQKPRARVSA